MKEYPGGYDESPEQALMASEEGQDLWSPNNSHNCRSINRTSFLYEKYNGIPDTLIINLVAFVVLLLLFTLLRKIAWDYGRLALVNRTEENTQSSLLHKGLSDKFHSILGDDIQMWLWTSLFFGERDRKAMGSQESLDTAVTSQDKGIFNWIVAFWRLTDADILNKCGRDAIQYLSFQRYLLVYVSIITVLSIAIILPINFQGNLLGTAVDFGHTTIGNLKTNDPILWVHAVMSVLYLIIVVFVLRHFHLNLDVEEDEQASRTLMVSNIPKGKCFHSPILQHFQEAYPEVNITDIQFAYNISDLVMLDNHRQAAAEAKVYCEIQLRKTGQRLQMRPVMCGQICCCCQRVDAINFYQEEEAELKRACEEEKLHAYQSPLGIAFITLGSESQAQKIRADFRASCKGTHNPQMSSLYQELHVQDWIMHFAPSPENIYWQNLSIPDWRWWTTAICLNSVLVVILFFCTTPIMFLHVLDMLKIDWKKPGEHLHSPFLVQFLPTLLLWISSALLPNIVYWSDQLIGHWTKTAEHHAVMRKTFIFLLLMVLILPSLGLTSANALFELIVMDSHRKMQWQCIFLPGNGSFFVNYIITAAFIGTSLELLRFPELFVYCIKLLLARSQAERAAHRKAALWDFQYGIQYAWMLCIVAIIVSYSIPCPLVTPFGLVYLGFKHIVDRYNIFFAYKPSRINKHIHSSAVTFVLWAVILLQFNITFFTGLRSEGFEPVFVFSCVALFITLLIAVGRISFGWFKYLRPSTYSYFEDTEQHSPMNEELQISKPFVANVLTQNLSDDPPPQETASTGYGSTQSSTNAEENLHHAQ